MPEHQLPEKSLAEMIALFLSENIEKRNLGWKLLYNRYSRQIYKNIWKKLGSSNKSELNSLVNDLHSKVWNIVEEKLPGFRKPEDKRAFNRWLQVICNNEINKVFRDNKRISGLDPEVLANDTSERSSFREREYYEEMVSKIRSTEKGKSNNLERDIQIYYLEFVYGMDPNSVYDHPCIGKYAKHRSMPEDHEKSIDKRRTFIQRISSRISKKLNDQDENR